MRRSSQLVIAGLAAAFLGCVSRAPAPEASRPVRTPTRTPSAAAESIAAAGLEAPATTLSDTPLPEPEREAEPAPLDPFPGRDRVSVDELAAAIDGLADELGHTPALRDDYLALVDAKGLVDSPELYRDYVRVKLAFEATRDGGWWHLHWAITNEQPNSEQIWSQWREAAALDPEAPVATATAECDELSALFAFLARKLGVHGIGLFWPTWNHVVAVWTIPGVQTEAGSPVRIVVPTSQIFLTEDDSLGTDGFDPWRQKTIYEYRRRDVAGDHEIEAELARFFVRQIAAHGGASQAQLQRAREVRAARLSAANL